MGRAPCCDKANVKRGPWSGEEDAKLKSYIEHHGTGGNWIALPQKIGLKRCGKSCRLRWLNYLRPNIKHGGFSEEEDNIICSHYISIGSRWSIIAAQLPGRTDNDIKNYWNTRLKKKLLGKKHYSRRGKQELKRGINGGEYSLLIPDNNNNNNSNNVVVDHRSSYWPELPVLSAAAPVPYSSQDQQRIESQASTRRLLIKFFGERFSDDQQLYEPTLHVPSSSSSSSPMDALNNNIAFGTDQFVNSQTQYMTSIEGSNYLQMVQGQSSFSSELQEMGFSNSPRLDHGMEFLYGELDMVNNSCESTINGWGINDITSCSLVCPPVVASSEFGFNELRYPGRAAGGKQHTVID